MNWKIKRATRRIPVRQTRDFRPMQPRRSVTTLPVRHYLAR